MMDTRLAEHGYDIVCCDYDADTLYCRNALTKEWSTWNRVVENTKIDIHDKSSHAWVDTDCAQPPVFGGSNPDDWSFKLFKKRDDIYPFAKKGFEKKFVYTYKFKHGVHCRNLFDSACPVDNNGMPVLFEGQRLRLKRTLSKDIKVPNDAIIPFESLVESKNGKIKFYVDDDANFKKSSCVNVYELDEDGDVYTITSAKKGAYEFVKGDMTPKKLVKRAAKEQPKYIEKSLDETAAVAASDLMHLADDTVVDKPAIIKKDAKDIATGIAIAAMTDSGITWIARRLARIAIERDQLEIAETLIDRVTCDVMKFMLPASLLGAAYAFSDSEDESTRDFCKSVIPGLKMAVTSTGANVMKHIVEMVTGNERNDIEEIRSLISDKRRARKDAYNAIR